eukprot:NODE_954_length_2919_cov_0.495035.p3 type:complete len:104 gc:universal NODE_954_length_2919_cov_0.495035:796-1107(+)
MQCYITNKLPADWQSSTVIEIFKSGNHLQPDRYRPVSLISTGLKIYQQMIYHSRFRKLLFPGPRQHGFNIYSIPNPLFDFDYETLLLISWQSTCRGTRPFYSL